MLASVRTTLDLDEDVLAAAKEIAASRGSTAGKVLSELARQALRPEPAPAVRNGVLLLASRGGEALRATLELVNRLRDAE